MRIHEILKRENLGKIYKCSYNNCDYKVVESGEFLSITNNEYGGLIVFRLSLETIINTEYEELL